MMMGTTIWLLRGGQYWVSTPGFELLLEPELESEVETEVEVGVEVGVVVESEVGVGVGVVEMVGVGVRVGAVQIALETVLLSKVTAPFRAKTLPVTVALVFRVMEVKAKIFPLKLVVVPSVAELPVCQKTLQAWALFMRLTLLPLAVVIVEPILKMKTASELPWPLSVSVPVNWAELSKQ